MLAGIVDEVHYYATPGEKIVDKVIYVSIKLPGGNCTQQLLVYLFFPHSIMYGLLSVILLNNYLGLTTIFCNIRFQMFLTNMVTVMICISSFNNELSN